MSDDLISIIGDSYFEPILALLAQLEKFDEPTNNEVQSGFFVNGFSASICLLAVACLESYTMRVRYVKKATQAEIDKVPVVKYLPKIFPNFPYTAELLELFIVRDVVTHNHLWEIGFDWSNGGMDLVSSTNRSSGDTKFKSQVDHAKRQTKKLSLNINPIKIGKVDAMRVLKTMWSILVFIQKHDINLCSVTAQHYKYHGRLVRFGEIIGMPETCT